MSYNKGFYNENLAEDAMAVVAKWIARVSGLKVVFHSGKAVCADIFKAIINIPRLACSSGLTEAAMMLLRGRIYHEAGHIAYTKLDKSEYPKGILHEIWNSIEDYRMEREVADNYVGAGPVFRWNAEYYNKKIAGDAAAGKVNAPLWEALVAMGFQSVGLPPKWRLSHKAQAYFDAGYDTFSEWRGLKNAKGSIKLAEKLYEILKETHEDYQNGQGEGGESNDDQDNQQGGGSGSGESQEGEEQEMTGRPNDFDNEGDDKQQGGGSGEADDDGEDEGAGGESQEDGAEGTESGAEGSEGEGEGSESEAEGEAAGGSENAEDADTQQGGNADKAKKPDGKPGDYDTNYDEGDGKGRERTDAEERALEKELEEEAQGKGMSDYQDEDIEQALDELDPADKKYLSRRDLDEHIMVKGTERDKETFKKDREEVAVITTAMTHALEQAMRARTRCCKNPYQRSGKIDNGRLVHIAKSISKEVFYKTRQGEKLETAVEIIIDESGSMGNYRKVRQVAIAVSEALAQLGIPFEVTGSTTKYGCGDSAMPSRDGLSRTNPIIYHHFKTFGQQWAQVRHNMSQSTAHMHNVDGEVVEYAARCLLNRPESRKIILSLSDGCPDAGHGNGSEMGKNIVRTCKRARKAGIEVYAFGLDTKAPAAYYGKENFVYIPDDEIDSKFVAAFVAIVSGGRFQVAVHG